MKGGGDLKGEAFFVAALDWTHVTQSHSAPTSATH